MLGLGFLPQKITLRVKNIKDIKELYVTGNIPELGNWDPGKIKMKNKDDFFEYSFHTSIQGDIEYKYTAGTWNYVEKSHDGNEIPNRHIRVGNNVLIEDIIERIPRNNSLTGDFIVFDDLEFKIIVYLPPDYYSSDKKYPVLYMHDGQNIFDSATSFAGVEWEMDETAQRLISQKIIAPVIIVGIYNRGEKRMYDYTPTFDKKRKCGGKSDKYADFIINTLKPYIDDKIRTLKDNKNTFIGGSSLGGLVSLWIAYKNPHIFSKVLAVSPSVWWDEKYIIKFIKEKKDLKIWLDMGTEESSSAAGNKVILKDVKELYSKLKKIGYNVEYNEYSGADHSEGAWADRVEDMLLFLMKNI